MSKDWSPEPLSGPSENKSTADSFADALSKPWTPPGISSGTPNTDGAKDPNAAGWAWPSGGFDFGKKPEPNVLSGAPGTAESPAAGSTTAESTTTESTTAQSIATETNIPSQPDPLSRPNVYQHADPDQPNPYWPSWQAKTASARTGKSGIGMLVGIGMIVAAVAGLGVMTMATSGFGAQATVVGGDVSYISEGTTGPADLESLAPDAGTIVFSDDFADPNSGWLIGSLGSGTMFAFEDSYVITGKGDLDHFAYSPSGISRTRLSVTATGSLRTGGEGDGLGVMCGRDNGSATLTYQFGVYGDGYWSIGRREGAIADSTREILLSGSGSVTAGETKITVQGTCESLDGYTTRLTLFVDGAFVGSYVDRVSEPSDSGWDGGLMVVSDEDGCVAVMTRYEERDLGQ